MNVYYTDDRHHARSTAKMSASLAAAAAASQVTWTFERLWLQPFYRCLIYLLSPLPRSSPGLQRL